MSNKVPHSTGDCDKNDYTGMQTTLSSTPQCLKLWRMKTKNHNKVKFIFPYFRNLGSWNNHRKSLKQGMAPTLSSTPQCTSKDVSCWSFASFLWHLKSCNSLKAIKVNWQSQICPGMKPGNRSLGRHFTEEKNAPCLNNVGTGTGQALWSFWCIAAETWSWSGKEKDKKHFRNLQLEMSIALLYFSVIWVVK